MTFPRNSAPADVTCLRPTLLALVFLLAGAGGVRADVVRMTTNYYKVYGATTRDVRESINQFKPWKDRRSMDAQTDWTVRAKYSVGEAGGVGRLQSFQTEAIITVTMPTWSPPPVATEGLTNRWQRYFTALLRHENGHAANALKAATEVRRRVTAIRDPLPSQELSRKISDTVTAVLKEYREKDEEYDRQTRHGVEQGAHFP
jgi:predicted secreted Zn-dependent protease